MKPSKWVKMTEIERIKYADSEKGMRDLQRAALHECPMQFCPKCGKPIRVGYKHNPIYCIDEELESKDV